MNEQDKQAVVNCVNELGPCGMRAVNQTAMIDDPAYTKELLEACVAEGRIAQKSNGQYIAADATKSNKPPQRQGPAVPEHITNATTDDLIRMAQDGKFARQEIKRRIKNL